MQPNELSATSTHKSETALAAARLQIWMSLIFVMMGGYWLNFVERESTSPWLVKAGNLLVAAGLVVLPVVLARGLYVIWSVNRRPRKSGPG